MPPKNQKAVYKAKQSSNNQYEPFGDQDSYAESPNKASSDSQNQEAGQHSFKYVPKDAPYAKDAQSSQYSQGYGKRGGYQNYSGQNNRGGYQNNARGDGNQATGQTGRGGAKNNWYKPNQERGPGSQNVGNMMSQEHAGGITPQMLAQTPQMLPHLANLQQMDAAELESLVLSLIDQCGPGILTAGMNQGPQRPNSGRGYQQFRGGNPQYQMGRGGPQNRGQGQRDFGPNNFNQNQSNSTNKNNTEKRAGMPIPLGLSHNQFPVMGQGSGFPSAATVDQQKQRFVYQAKQAKDSEASGEESKAAVDFSATDLNAAGLATQSSMFSVQQDETLKQVHKQQEGNQQQRASQPGFSPFMINPSTLMPGNIGVFAAQQNQITRNLCEKHFPEPIIIFLEGPKCKKCISEQVAQNQGKTLQNKQGLPNMQTIQMAKMLGLNSLALNMFQTEKSQISRSLERINLFKRELRMMQEDIKQRQDQSTEYLDQLPPLMNSMFEKLEEQVQSGEQKFKNKIFQIVRNQQKNIQDDMKTKLPQFYQRLVQKYNQLQQASNLAQVKGADELINTLQHYLKIFNELDSEYEKYFNDYEKMSKLQRLLDKDANEIVEDFVDLVERNLRVDYNIKNSFGPHLPQRLHSFQWNQRCSQIYRIRSGTFEKKQVQMQYEVPLYSRSIATETGTIYLTGGFIKQANVYLKNCYRYDEIFGMLQPVSSMNFPHADHSVCSIQGFIYVVGTFVNNQVYGCCEVYDTQKDKWKQIDDMRVPRTGVSLCTFKNNYIFAFGGRVDQKRIVDTIEVYDISRNVWQQIENLQIDKSNWVPAYMGLAYQITDNEIILFGGKSAITFQIFNGCFVFDVEKMEIKERGSLVNPCSFMNTPLVFNNNLYAYGNDVYVHCYNIPEHKWSAISKSSIVLPKA